MPTISLAPYTIRVRHRKEKRFLRLGELDQDVDAFDLFQRFLASLETQHDSANRTLFRLIRFEAEPRSRVLEGMLETGEYGYETKLIDVKVDTSNVTYHRKVSEAELLPFYFRLDIPKRKDQGFLILQRFGNLGIKAVLEDALAKHFAGTAYIVELHPLVPEQVIERWTRARDVRRLRLVSFEVPKTIDEIFQLGDSKEVYAELVIRAKRGHTFPLPGRLRSREGFVEIQDGEAELERLRRDLQGFFQPDALKLEVSVAGKTRTVDVTDPGNLVAYHDVTEAVSPLDRNGHPAWDRIRDEARKLARDLHATVNKLAAARAQPPALPSRETSSAEPEIDRKAG